MRIDFKKIEKDLMESKIILFTLGSKYYPEFSTHLLKFMLSKPSWKCIYVGVVKPYVDVKKNLEKNKVDTKRIYFIDCISRTVAEEIEEKPGVAFLLPADLTGLAIAIDEAINKLGEKDFKVFLFFDTLSTFLIYSSAPTLARFSHFITGRIRLKNLKGIILTLEEQVDKAFFASIKSFCDKVIEIK